MIDIAGRPPPSASAPAPGSANSVLIPPAAEMHRICNRSIRGNGDWRRAAIVAVDENADRNAIEQPGRRTVLPHGAFSVYAHRRRRAVSLRDLAGGGRLNATPRGLCRFAAASGCSPARPSAALSAAAPPVGGRAAAKSIPAPIRGTPCVLPGSSWGAFGSGDGPGGTALRWRTRCRLCGPLSRGALSAGLPWHRSWGLDRFGRGVAKRVRPHRRRHRFAVRTASSTLWSASPAPA